jgi:hypothetical protein
MNLVSSYCKPLSYISYFGLALENFTQPSVGDLASQIERPLPVLAIQIGLSKLCSLDFFVSAF